jgi:hypothetical protein
MQNIGEVTNLNILPLIDYYTSNDKLVGESVVSHSHIHRHINLAHEHHNKPDIHHGHQHVNIALFKGVNLYYEASNIRRFYFLYAVLLLMLQESTHQVLPLGREH